MRFSIITVTYNSCLTLKETIESVINQTYKDFELIIIDGGSTDGTIELIKSYGEKIRWISEPDKGIYDAMNKGLKVANGDFVLFLGSDDHFMSYRILEHIEKYIRDLNAVYYGRVYRSIRDDLYRNKWNKYLLSMENICHQAILYPRSLYKEKEYSLEYPVYADYVYNIEAYKSYRFFYIPLAISYYNYEGFSSIKKDKSFEKDCYKLIKDNLGVMCVIIRKLYQFYKKIR